MRWKELNSSTKRYILYHTLSCPLLFSWYMVPYYLFKTGYNVFEIGVLYTIVNISSLPLTYLLGRYFSYRDVRKGLALIDFLGFISFILYFLARGDYAPLLIFSAMLVEEISGIFYPLYSAYEKAIYPSEKLKEIMEWHLRLPEIAVVLSYPFLGYFYTFICNETECILNGFLVFAFIEIFFIIFILKFFEPIILKQKISGDESFRLVKLPLSAIAYILYISGWIFIPSFTWINFILEKYKGNLFYIAIVESSISLASVTATYISKIFPEKKSFEAMTISIVLVIISLTLISISPSFLILVLLSYALRVGDALWFIHSKTWLYHSIEKKDATEVMATISSINRGIELVSPLFAGLLSQINPSLPFLTGLIFILSSIPLILKQFKWK